MFTYASNRHFPAIAIALSFAPVAAGVGTGQFVDSGLTIPQALQIAVELGDFDADGDLDAFTNAYVNPSTVWLNGGSAAFTGTGQVLGMALSNKIVIADFDGDRDPDALVVSHSFSSTLWRSNGRGQFTSAGQAIGSAGVHSADAGDLDGDGDIDLFVGEVAGHMNTVAFNDGHGFFTFSIENHGPIAARAVALGDVDGDGDLDAFLALAEVFGSSHADRVLLNDGAGHFTDSGQLLDLRHGDDVALVDLDGDGDLDAFVGNSSPFGSDPADTIWFNNGAGVFTDSGQRLGSSDCRDLDLADLDNDGDLDAFIGDFQGPITVWFNDGRGFFTDSGQALLDGELNSGSALGDLDGDGDADAFAITGSGIHILLNVNGPPQSADLNGDGQVGGLDLAMLLAAWGNCPLDSICGCPADLNCDGSINGLDLAMLLAAWG